jgi:hypothetical protein
MSTKRKTTKPAAKTIDAILAAFHARAGTNRAKLIAALARNLGKPVSIADLIKATYGNGPHTGMSNAIAGVEIMIATHKLGYRLTKSGEGSEASLTLACDPLAAPAATIRRTSDPALAAGFSFALSA